MEKENCTKRKNRIYLKFRQFSCMSEANDYINNNKICGTKWTKYNAKDNKNDRKIFYYCYREKNCPKRMCISQEENKVTIFVSADEHKHREPKGISADLRREIAKYLEDDGNCFFFSNLKIYI